MNTPRKITIRHEYTYHGVTQSDIVAEFNSYNLAFAAFAAIAASQRRQQKLLGGRVRIYNKVGFPAFN